MVSKDGTMRWCFILKYVRAIIHREKFIVLSFFQKKKTN